jgi:hypothetical protein
MRRAAVWIGWAVAGAALLAAPLGASVPLEPDRSEAGTALPCGTARWAVRTLADPAARLVDLRPRPVSFAQVHRYRPARVGPRTRRLKGVERTTFRLTARLVDARLMPNGAIRVVLADRRTGQRTVSVELPDLACKSGGRSARERQLERARSAFVASCGVPTRAGRRLAGTAVVTGVGFFNPSRGAVGAAPNRLDLQPALEFRGEGCHGDDAVLLAAGDIASCDSGGDEATAGLLARLPGTIATLGDNVYDSGTSAEFGRCYHPSWGRFKSRTRPSPGNHDYETAGAAGYFGYFGAAAGEPGKGYYSYDLGSWHVIALNSNCGDIGGCKQGSPQERWLAADLAQNATRCTLAYWHHPRFSSGLRHGSDGSMWEIFRTLYEHGADVALGGHEHNYERFAPQSPTGALDPARGIRTFVAGTGGKSLHPLGQPLPASEARNDRTYGVLELTLKPTGYSWRFHPVAGRTFTDSGSDSCH